MHAWQVFKLDAFIDSLVSLSTAFILGSIIGYERQYRQRTAGLRTNALVAIAAAAFVDMAHQINGATGTTQVAAYVVSGVGFLGAGTIMKEGLNVRGLNTAATLGFGCGRGLLRRWSARGSHLGGNLCVGREHLVASGGQLNQSQTD